MDLLLFPGFREGWIFTAVIKNKFWACDCSCNYLVSKVKSSSENNNTMLAKPSVVCFQTLGKSCSELSHSPLEVKRKISIAFICAGSSLGGSDRWPKEF